LIGLVLIREGRSGTKGNQNVGGLLTEGGEVCATGMERGYTNKGVETVLNRGDS